MQKMEFGTDLPAPTPLRLTGALFFLALGFALQSVCLFRLMAFSTSSTAFFVLYLAAGMPMGAYLAERRRLGGPDSLRLSLFGMFALAALVPLLGWVATRGQGLVISGLSAERFDLRFVWIRLVYQALVVAPFFAAWGFAEFVGYRTAMRSDSRRLRTGFYGIFVWALALALLVGSFAIPGWGLLRTLVLTVIAGVIALVCLGARRAGLVGGALVPIAWLAAGQLEAPFVRALQSDGPYGVGTIISTGRLPWEQHASPETRLLHATWGRFSHVALVEQKRSGVSLLFGAYDGVIHWTVNSRMTEEEGTQVAPFEISPEGADVAILGAGGGRQVAHALRRAPGSVVAVDVIPEVFSLFKGPYSAANGNVYRSPKVETVVADGRRYLDTAGRSFDLIVLPHTESFGAAVRALLEPGQSLHTVEAFSMMATHLNPGGVLAIYKHVDLRGRLFHAYAATLRRAGLSAIGWLQNTEPSPGAPGQAFVLLAAREPQALVAASQLKAKFPADRFDFVDFQATAPASEAIYDDSPWVAGLLGNWAPAHELRRLFFGLAALAALGVVASLALSLRGVSGTGSAGARLAFAAAGVGVGVHAVCLQNAVIFWLLLNLFNPLAAFFVGSAGFLLAWGLSSWLQERRKLLLLLVGVGLVGMLLSGWRENSNLLAMACVAVGSGFCFPLLALKFESRLLGLFVADAIGGFVGGLLAIWLPVLSGFKVYFALLPWICVLTVAFTLAAASLAARRAGPAGSASP
jgi:spermidine synthase